MYRGRTVAIVVPAYGEERLVGRTLRSIPPWVDRIVLVDDASPDATAAAAASTGDARLVVLRHPDNRGVGAAIATGTEAALASGASVVAVMAADGQMDPVDLPGLLDPIVDGRADYVKGNRFIRPARRDMPLARRIAGRALAAVTRLATGLDVDDSQCGYTAIAADAARSLPLDDLWPRYGYPNDLLGMLAHRQLRVTEVPVRPVYADEESGIRPWHFLVVLWVIGRRWGRGRPGHRTEVPLPR